MSSFRDIAAPAIGGTGVRSRHLLAIAIVLLVDFGLVFLHVTILWLPAMFQPLFDLDTEASIPAWYSALKMTAIGAMILFLAYRAVGNGPQAFTVAALGAALVAMSLDEVVGLHERVGFLVDLVLFDRTDSAVSATGIWFVVLGVPVIAVLALLILQSARLLGTVRGTGAGLLAGFALFFLGALVFEGLTNVATDPATYHLVVAAEEGIELLGLTVLLVVMARCVARHPLTAPVVALAMAPVAPLDRRRTAEAMR